MKKKRITKAALALRTACGVQYPGEVYEPAVPAEHMPLHTFILRICNLEGTDYPVQLLRAPDDGSPEVLISACRFAAAELAALPWSVPGVPRAVRDMTVPVASRAPAGTALYGLIIRDELRAAWVRLQEDHPYCTSINGGHRIILEVVPDELHEIAWEHLGAPPLFPAKDLGNSFVRGPVAPAAAPEPLDRPLRVLVVIGSQANDPRVKAEEELAELERTFWDLRHRLDFQVLHQPTRQLIEAACRAFRPHVFHFIGHGRIGADGPQLELFANTPQEWSVSDIYNDMSPAQELGFAFLNACHTAAVPDQQVPGCEIWSLHRTFFHRGVRAVLAMQGPVPGASAAFFSGAVYRALVSGDPIDLALTEARQQLPAQPDAGQHDWAIPALYLRTRPECVLPLARPIPPALIDEVRNAIEFQHNGLFVDRRVQREDLLGRVQTGPGPHPGGLIVVRGERRIGKSGLLRYCLEGLALWGYPVKYIDLTNQPADPLQLLRMIRDGSRALLDPTLPPGAFATFNRTVNALLGGADPRAPGVLDRYPDADQGAPLGGGVESLLDQLFEAFIGALCAAAPLAAPDPTRPLLLVLDHLTERGGGGLQQGVFDTVLRRLAAPFARRSVPRMVLILGAEGEAEYPLIADALAKFRLNVESMAVTLPNLTVNEFVPLAGEFCRRRNIPGSLWGPVVQALAAVQPPAGWSPAYLERVSGLFSLSGGA